MIHIRIWYMEGVRSYRSRLSHDNSYVKLVRHAWYGNV